ncbi:MAG: tRNA dihydrouridine synthase DusB, partial [Bacillota bacterium]
MFMGNELTAPVVVAPMAGVTDYPYRQLLRKLGAELVYTEMVSSKGLVYGSPKTRKLMDFRRHGGLIGVQLFGSEPEVMGKAARIIEEDFRPDLIDINMGCPTAKVVKNGAGSALMKNPDRAQEVIGEVVEAVSIPVTVKLRAGWDKQHQNAPLVARLAEDSGVRAVCVHGRTREQFYRGQADWNIITRVKQTVGLHVIGNGDVFSPEAAASMLGQTGCDLVMLARGIQGNPWLVPHCQHYLKTGKMPPLPDYQERLAMARDHLQRAVDYFGESVAIPRMRKHLSWYV